MILSLHQPPALTSSWLRAAVSLTQHTRSPKLQPGSKVQVYKTLKRTVDAISIKAVHPGPARNTRGDTVHQATGPCTQQPAPSQAAGLQQENGIAPAALHTHYRSRKSSANPTSSHPKPRHGHRVNILSPICLQNRAAELMGLTLQSQVGTF